MTPNGDQLLLRVFSLGENETEIKVWLASEEVQVTTFPLLCSHKRKENKQRKKKLHLFPSVSFDWLSRVNANKRKSLLSG